jgi:hypothetical protein
MGGDWSVNTEGTAYLNAFKFLTFVQIKQFNNTVLTLYRGTLEAKHELIGCVNLVWPFSAILISDHVVLIAAMTNTWN